LGDAGPGTRRTATGGQAEPESSGPMVHIDGSPRRLHKPRGKVMTYRL